MTTAHPDAPTDAHARTPVDVWQLPLAAGAAQTRLLVALLAPDELRRAERLSEPTARHRFVVAHGLTRWVLGRRLGADPRTLTWDTGPQGKPGPVGTDKPVHWSLSHSGPHALLAVSSLSPLGVDIQAVRSDVPVLALARRFLPSAQYAEVAAQDCDERRRTSYYRALCRNEARVKAVGGRLFDTLRPVLGQDPRPHIPAPAQSGRPWRLQDLPAPSGYVAALAVSQHTGPPVGHRLVRPWPAADAGGAVPTVSTVSLRTPKGPR